MQFLSTFYIGKDGITLKDRLQKRLVAFASLNVPCIISVHDLNLHLPYLMCTFCFWQIIVPIND